MSSPQFKTGRHSKYLPARLLSVYQDSLADEQLTSVKADIALLDSLIMENIQSLDLGSNAQFWELALEQIKWARQGYKQESYGMLERALDELEALADQRRLHFAAEKELREKLEQRRKMVETDGKLSLQGERAITAGELIIFMTAFVDLINRKVPDAKQRNDLLIGIDQLMAGNPKPVQ